MAMDVDTDEAELRMEGGEEMGGGMRLLVPRLSEGGKLFVGEPTTLSLISLLRSPSSNTNQTPPPPYSATTSSRPRTTLR